MENKKSGIITFILCIFFGYFGFHKFYLGRKSGLLHILLPVIGIIFLGSSSQLFIEIGWVFIVLTFLLPFIDMVRIFTTGIKDKEGNRVRIWNN